MATLEAFKSRLFELGSLATTPGALETFSHDFLLTCLARHAKGDWGEGKDHQINDVAVRDGDRILSSYKDENSVELWIVTEADRSVTTMLLPSEY